LAIQQPTPRRHRHRHRPSRAVYRRRRITLLLLLLGLVALISWGAVRLVQRNLGRAAQADLPWPPAQMLKVGNDLSVAISAPKDGHRRIVLVAGTGAQAKPVGPDWPVEDVPLSIKDINDLPRSGGPVLWADRRLKTEGQRKEVAIPGGKATEANGGEPNPRAWRIVPGEGLKEIEQPLALLAPAQPPQPTAILVDPTWNVLWYFEEGQLILTRRVSTGRFLKAPPITAANWQQNHLTPRGEFKVALRQEGLPVHAQGLAAGDPRNPYGSRWLGFSVLQSDGAVIWGIHGTPKPSEIGKWNTNGTVAMKNEDVEALYERVKVGTPVIILGGE
jgi:lipoprotein-anchoring transpeptidase ErfK/SrfK